MKFCPSYLVLFSFFLPVQISIGPYLTIIISFIVHLVVLTFVIYVAGRIVLGGEKAKFSRAFAIVLVAEVIIFVLNFVLSPLILYAGLMSYASIINILVSIIAWLALIKSLYVTGWLGAIVVAILAIIIEILLEILLNLIFVALQIFLI